MKKTCVSLLASLGLALLTMGFQCNKDYPPAKPVYEYEEKLTLTPYKKSYKIGDTISVQFQSSDKTLFDKLTGTRIPNDTTFLQVLINLGKIYPKEYAVYAISDVEVDSATDVSFIKSVLDFKTYCNRNNYFFRAHFVVQQAGVYFIYPRGIFSPCPTRSPMPYSTFRFTFDVVDCNKDVYQTIPSYYRGGEYTENQIDNKEMFVFKVE